jgi:hypothetical protein
MGTGSCRLEYIGQDDKMKKYRKSNSSVFAAIVALLITDWVFRPRSDNNEYHDCLKSDHWKEVRQYVGSKANWNCEVNGCARHGHNLNCHHLTYKHLGDERWGEVVYVCPEHHKLIHKNNAFNKRGGGVIPSYQKGA